jgi:hypothetical protein
MLLSRKDVLYKSLPANILGFDLFVMEDYSPIGGGLT